MEVIIILLSIGGSIILMGLIILFIIDIIEWLIHSDDKPRIKFTQFKKIYDINPDRWILDDDTVGFREQNSMGSYYSFAKEEFRFGFIDHFKYYVFKNKLDKIKRQKKESEALLSVIKVAKEDIAEFERRNKKKMEDAIDNIQKVTDNISDKSNMNELKIMKDICPTCGGKLVNITFYNNDVATTYGKYCTYCSTIWRE